MSIWNKVLIGLILVVAPAGFIFGARALKTHKYWRELAQKFDASLETVQAENQTLKEGAPGDAASRGIRQVKLDLHKILLDRGRVWTNVTPGNFDPQTGAISVSTDLPDPSGIELQTVLHAFEERPFAEGGRYIGEFIVKEKANKQLVLQPAYKMAPDELEQLRQSRSRGQWVLRDVVPVDSHEIFAGLDEATTRAMFPQGAVDEYLKDGKKGPDGNLFTRDLRDYRVLLTSFHEHRAILTELLEAAKRDNQYMKAALDDAKLQEQFHNTEIANLKKLLEDETKQLAAVTSHLKAVQDKLAQLRNGVDQLIQSNQQAAGRIAQIQLEAIRRIDEETRRMAQVTE